MSALELRLSCHGEHGFRLQLDCQLPDRGITGIYGPSGSGKTTLLHCIAGLRRAEAGSVIRFRDRSWQQPDSITPPWRRRIGFVFQDSRLLPHLDVAGNLDYAVRRQQDSGGPAREQVIEWLDLGPMLPRSSATLSAGQKQRVAIGRALLTAPLLLLLDEPLANLDQAARSQCIYYLQRLRDELDLPMLYVSHDIEETTQLADHLVLLDGGRMERQGPVLELCSALDTRLSHEEQAASIVLGTIARHDEDFGLTELSLDGHPLYVNHLPQAAGQRRRLRIPARDVSVCLQRPQDSSILNILPATLAEIEDTSGARVLLRLRLGEQYLLARITRKSASRLGLQVGDALFAQVKSAALLSEAGDPP